MMRALSPREARLVAILILLALVALVELAIVQPVVSGFATRAERRAMLLTRYQVNDRTIASIPRLRRGAEAQAHLADDFTVPAPDAATAAEALRERMQRAVETIGGEFRGAEPIAPRPGWTAVRVTARLAQPQLVRLLAAVQNDRPYPIVDTLIVTADEALVTGRPATLDVQFDAAIPLRAPAPR